MNERSLLQRLLDGELDAAEEAELRARAAQDPKLAAELSAFDALAENARRLTRPLPMEGLEQRVLERVAKTPAPGPGLLTQIRSFLMAPHSWAASGALTAGLIGLVSGAWWLGYHTGSVRAREAVAQQGTKEVVVRFAISAPSARTVEVAGDFNAWRPERAPLAQGPGGTWAATLKMAPGRHEYLFVVDGKRWVPDPSAAEVVDDGFGGKNAVIEVL